MPRAERNGITGLGLIASDAVLSLDAGDEDSSSDLLNSATVYVGIDPTGAGIVRVTLQAEVLGQRQTVASAFVVPGFVGIAIDVTGLNVDGWHVLLSSSNPALRCKVALAAKHCCAGLAVFVPPALLDAPIDQGATEAQLAALFTPAPNPMMRRAGQYFVHSNDGGAGSFTMLPGERVTHAEVHAGAMGDASITFTTPRGQTQVWVVDAGEDAELFPEGNLPVASVAFTNVAKITIETVR